MTHIYTVHSGSSGNTYLLESNNQVLILELGCRFEDICASFHYNFDNVIGAIYTHFHGDHLNKRTAKEFIRRGISVYAGEEVAKECAESGVTPLFSGKINRVGQYSIQTFKAPHNVPNYGFLIDTPTKERIIFLTDTTGVNIRFKNVNCIMIECNHDEETMLENMEQSNAWYSYPEYHLSLDKCIDFCRENKSVVTSQIILLHPSLGNLNTVRALERVKQELNFDNVTFANQNERVTIENTDF